MESFKSVVLLTKHFAVQTTREQAKRSKHRTNMSKSQVQGWIKHSLYGPPVGPNSCTGTEKVCEFGETSSFAWIFCSHDIKATFETCPGRSTGLGGVSPVGKPCLAGVAPTLPSPFIVTAAAAGSHTAGTTLNPGLESAQSPLCLPIGGGGCTQLETGGRFGWSFFVRSEECDARTGSRLASTVSPGGDKAVGAQRKREEASSAAKWGGTKLKRGQAEGQKSHCLVLLCCDLSSFILTSNLLSPVFKKRPIYLLPCP